MGIWRPRAIREVSALLSWDSSTLWPVTPVTLFTWNPSNPFVLGHLLNPTFLPSGFHPQIYSSVHSPLNKLLLTFIPHNLILAAIKSSKRWAWPPPYLEAVNGSKVKPLTLLPQPCCCCCLRALAHPVSSLTKKCALSLHILHLLLPCGSPPVSFPNPSADQASSLPYCSFFFVALKTSVMELVDSLLRLQDEARHLPH